MSKRLFYAIESVRDSKIANVFKLRYPSRLIAIQMSKTMLKLVGGYIAADMKKEVDRVRGDIPHSKFFMRAIEHYLNHLKEDKNKSK